MVNLKIDGIAVSVAEGTTILAAAKSVGIDIPTLCYFKDLNEIGACRVCVVEVKGSEKLSAACNTPVAEGMEVLTNSERVRTARRINVELILSQHSCHCPTCVRNGNCALQKLAGDLNITELPYETKLPKFSWDKTSPLIRDAQKCINCYRCVNVCDKIQSLKVWEVNGSGAHTKVGVRDGLSFSEVNCSLCGQCITHCPVGALSARDDTEKAFRMLADKERITVIQIAPAVRAAWGDGLGLPAELATEKRMAACAKALGADYVFDTNFTADLTIMEEGSEFLERLTKNAGKMPMFTSCCPGWVRFLKLEYPELADHLSTAKSPQQMFGAVTKSYFAEKIGVSPDQIDCISIMPCTAKKYECDVPEVNSASAKDVDLVLSTREFTRMIRAAHINAAAIPECDFDSPLGTGTGAAVIFGATGGVMEAALRSAYFLVTGKNPDSADDFKSVRSENGNTGIREIDFAVGGATVRTAVASGLANARVLCEQVKAGTAPYDFIEIMACPGGCAGGGGQPICEGEELALERGNRLYELDKNNPLRYSHENPEVKALYADFLEKPLSHKSHELLHTKQSTWTL